MIFAFSREDARAFDRDASEVGKVPSLLLMENAGRAATDVIERDVLARDLGGSHVVVLCGTGQNGGDGFVVARHASVRGATTRTFVVGDPDRIRGDARVPFDAHRASGAETTILGEGAPLDALRAELSRADVVVDALFGTGLSRPLDGIALTVVSLLREVDAPVVALDLPSGLDADTGAVLGDCVKAHTTVTFAAPKLGLLTPLGSVNAGRVVVADIGVPVARASTTGFSARVVEPTDVASWVAPRSPDTHKFGAGSVVVFGGTAGTVGAPLLTAHGVLRAGAGLVTVASSDETIAALDSRVLEIMTRRLDSSRIDADVSSAIGRAKALVVGPGFGRSTFARDVVRAIFTHAKVPVIVDADALTLVAEDPSLLGAPHVARVFTPHAGEAARLLGTTSEAVEKDRFAAVRAMAARYGAVVVLKGARSLVATPSGFVHVHTSGHPVLATAGSGDVLAGAVAAFACGLAPEVAADVAVHLHGRAGERFASRVADRGLLAHEIADEIPHVLGELMRGFGETRCCPEDTPTDS
ncbi:MAG: NAD(P)H-hydrate dehydratase [Polyangiaceae bacterium]